MRKEEEMKVTLHDNKDAPNLQKLKDAFEVSEEDIIIAYGDKIYSPNKQITHDLLVHEMVHCERQGYNERSAERWWERYMEDKEFRLNEEILAYKQQYLYCCRVYTDRNRRHKILYALAKELAHERYGKLCTNSKAMDYLK